jgi:hypothetical protein
MTAATVPHEIVTLRLRWRALDGNPNAAPREVSEALGRLLAAEGPWLESRWPEWRTPGDRPGVSDWIPPHERHPEKTDRRNRRRA